MNWLNVPKKIYFKRGSMAVAFKELSDVYGAKRAFIITHADLYKKGAIAPVVDLLMKRGIQIAEFFTAANVPTFENARSGLPKMLEFQPDVIIGIGRGSIMSLAKVMWLLYENPELDLDDVAKKFSSTTAGYAAFPATGKKAMLTLIATTAGSGAECSPFAVINDDKGKKRVIASYRLLPEIAVIDCEFTMDVPADLTKSSGMLVLTQAVRALTAPTTTEYVRGFAKDAIRNVFTNLPLAVESGAANPIARENMANASVLAGMAIANAVDTLEDQFTFYPTAEEKDIKKVDAAALAAIVDVAKSIGITGTDDKKVFAEWIAACEKLAAL